LEQQQQRRRGIDAVELELRVAVGAAEQKVPEFAGWELKPVKGYRENVLQDEAVLQVQGRDLPLHHQLQFRPQH